MGFVMLCTMGSFLKERDGFIAEYMWKTTGATVGFVLFFSMFTCLISYIGYVMTKDRKMPIHFLGCYGVLLFFLGFIPLIVVSDALLTLGSVTENDIIAMCYYNVND